MTPHGACAAYVPAELGGRRLALPKPVGQHDLALADVRRRIRKFGVVHPQRLAPELAVSPGDEQFKLQRRVLQERGETEHAVNISTPTGFH